MFMQLILACYTMPQNCQRIIDYFEDYDNSTHLLKYICEPARKVHCFLQKQVDYSIFTWMFMQQKYLINFLKIKQGRLKQSNPTLNRIVNFSKTSLKHVSFFSFPTHRQQHLPNSQFPCEIVNICITSPGLYWRRISNQ